ncbi:MAG: GxxExxY protein [Balneolaceae bacterium]
MNNKIQDQLTYNIIGCAMKVHSIMGNGFQEVVYQRALKIEMKQQSLSFQREVEMPLYYKKQPVGRRRVDFLVEEEVLVELKAVSKLDDIHLAQGLNYLKAYQLDKGLLLNFGTRSLEIKRLRIPLKDNPLIY